MHFCQLYKQVSLVRQASHIQQPGVFTPGESHAVGWGLGDNWNHLIWLVRHQIGGRDVVVWQSQSVSYISHETNQVFTRLRFPNQNPDIFLTVSRATVHMFESMGHQNHPPLAIKYELERILSGNEVLTMFHHVLGVKSSQQRVGVLNVKKIGNKHYPQALVMVWRIRVTLNFLIRWRYIPYAPQKTKIELFTKDVQPTRLCNEFAWSCTYCTTYGVGKKKVTPARIRTWG